MNVAEKCSFADTHRVADIHSETSNCAENSNTHSVADIHSETPKCAENSDTHSVADIHSETSYCAENSNIMEPIPDNKRKAEQSNSPGCENNLNNLDVPLLSKKKRKRLERQEKRKPFMKEMRAKERQRKKERRKEMREQGILLPPSRNSLKRNIMSQSSCKVKVVLDCSFDDLMTEKDIKSIVRQVNFSYASNRRADNPMQLYVTSFNKRLKQSMVAIGDYHKWDLNVDERSYEEIFPKENIVYLSSDSQNMLETLDDDKIYIIGGLVDHNHHKGLCHRLAEEKGLAHAQLPISEYVTMETRNVLAVNHVFEILLRFTESHSWEDAFYKVIPKRKIAGLTSDSDKTGEDNSVNKVNTNNSVNNVNTDNSVNSGSTKVEHLSSSVKTDDDDDVKS